jgi:hypothetical protein
MKKISKLVGIIILTMIIGCTTIPTQEMSDARQALNAANDVNAKYYAPNKWQQAQQNLKQAENFLINNQFPQARTQANLVKKQAVSAYHMAVSIKRKQVTTLK